MIERIRTAVRAAVSSTVKFARVTEVFALNDYSVQVPGHVDQSGRDVPMRLRSLTNTAHVVGEQVVIAWTNPKARNVPPLWVILDATSRLVDPSRLHTLWPRRRYDQARTGRLEPAAKIPATLTAYAAVNDHPTRFVRALKTAILQVGLADVWTADTTRAVEWTQLLVDALDRLYAVEGDRLKLYLLSDLTTAVAETALASVELEAVIVSGGIAVAHAADETAWTWTMHGATTLDLRSTYTMAWDGWTSPRGLTHSALGGPYPIVASVAPIYSHEASASPRIQPIVIGNIVVPPGDDLVYTEVLQAHRESPLDYEHTQWLCVGQERPQVQGVDLRTGSRAWSFGSDAAMFPESANGSMTPVLAVGDRVIAHWERTDWESITFAHYLADVLVATPGTWIAEYNAAHVEFGYSLPSAGGYPWQNDDPAPRWAWDYNYTLAGLIDALKTDPQLEPAFSASITRDYQAHMTHGMVSLLNGTPTASIEWGDPDAASPYLMATDTGDPDCSVHKIVDDPLLPQPWGPRDLYDPDLVISGVVTITPAETAGYASFAAYLLAHALMDSTQAVSDYIAAETFQGNEWATDAGGHASVFYRGHIWYGGRIDDTGLSTLATPPFVYIDEPDTVGGYAHTTTSVTYYYRLLQRVMVPVTWSDSKYGWDPHNPVASADKVMLLPRRLTRPMPTVLPVYWPLTELTRHGHPNLGFDANGRVVSGNGTAEYLPYDKLSAVYINRPDFDAAAFEPLDRTQVDPEAGPWSTSVSPAGGDRPLQLLDGHYVWERGFRVVLAPANTDDQRPAHLNANYAFKETGYYNSHSTPGADLAAYYFAPAHGYWYDGGDPRDPANWTPVDWTRLDTGLRGVKGDIPRGGSYHPPAGVGPPHIPAYGEGTPCTMLALDAVSLEESWRHEFGADLQLSAPPDAVVHEDRVYLAMFSPRVKWLLVDHILDENSYAEIAYYITQGFTSLAGSTASMSDLGRARIDYVSAVDADPPETWWARFLAAYEAGILPPGLPATDAFLANGTINWPVMWDWLLEAACLHDGRVPVPVKADIIDALYVPSQWTAPAQITIHDLADGHVIQTLEVDVAAGTQNVELVVIDGKLILAADSGRYDITG